MSTHLTKEDLNNIRTLLKREAGEDSRVEQLIWKIGSELGRLQERTDTPLEEIRFVNNQGDKPLDNPYIRYSNITHFLNGSCTDHPTPELNLIHGVSSTIAIDIVRCLRDWHELLSAGLQFTKLRQELKDLFAENGLAGKGQNMKRPERLLHSDKRAFMGGDIITALFMHYDGSGECPIYFRASINPKDKTYEASIYSTSEDNTKLFTPEELLHTCLSGSLKPENKECTDEIKNLTSYDIMRYVTSFKTSPIPPRIIRYITNTGDDTVRYKLILTYTPDDRSIRQTKTEHILEIPYGLDKYAIVKAAMESIGHKDLHEEQEYEIREQLHPQTGSEWEYSFYSLDGENHYEIIPEQLESLARIRPEDITRSDIAAVEHEVGLRTVAWDTTDPKLIIAAAVRVILSRHN